MSLGTMLAERGLVGESLIRSAIRQRCRALLETLNNDNDPGLLLQQLQQAETTVAVDEANRQHYEVTSEFFQRVLGTRLKYSCCRWDEPTDDLEAAERASLDETCRRAELQDGMRVLELGCGWGSLTLWMAEHFPASRITALSNSKTQKSFIQRQLSARQLDNVEVVTADIAEWRAKQRFDRVVSVEMFEHVRNHGRLLQRIADWLEPQGALFVHHFCHRKFAYLFDHSERGNWIAQHFFTGGMMPSFDWLSRFDQHLVVQRQHWINGRHYYHTSNAWYERMMARSADVRHSLAATYGKDVNRWFHRWRIFFLTCAELFGMDDGQQWGVGHYLLAPRD